MRNRNWMLVALLIGVIVLLLFGVFGNNARVDVDEKGNVDTTGHTIDVAVVGDYAYVADGGNGLVIVDVTNKSEPKEAGHYGTSGYASDVAVAGDYAYVADGENGLAIVDITNKNEPKEAGHYGTSGYASDVAVAGDYAYVADGDGLVIVDITNKSEPKEVGNVDTAGRAYGVAVAGDYAYVADYDNGLVVVDITNKVEPQEIGNVDTAGDARGVVVVGNYAYVTNSDFIKYYGENGAASARGTGDGLIIVDITNKTNPQVARLYDTSGNPLGVAVIGDYAYVADGDNGLVIVDVTDESDHHKAGGYATPGYARGVAVVGDYAYVADGSNGLIIVEISERYSYFEMYAMFLFLPFIVFLSILVTVFEIDSRKQAKKQTAEKFISKTRNKEQHPDFSSSTLLTQAEGTLPTNPNKAHTLAQKAHDQMNKENELYEKLQHLLPLVSRKQPGADTKTAQELHGRALIELKNGNFNETENLISQAELAARPSTDHLLTQARKLDIAAEEDYEKKNYDAATKKWEQAKAIYTRARELMEARKELKLLEKVNEKIDEISKNVKQALKNKAATYMVRLVGEYDRKVTEANTWFEKTKFGQALDSYELAKQKIKDACKVARENKFKDLQKVSDKLSKVKKAVEDTRLRIGKKNLDAIEPLVNSDPQAAEKKFLEVEQYLNGLKLENDKACKQLKTRSWQGIAKARIAQRKRDFEEAKALYEKDEFVKAKKRFSEVEASFHVIRDYAVERQLTKIKMEVDSHINACRTNIDLATDAPFHKGKGMKHLPVELGEEGSEPTANFSRRPSSTPKAPWETPPRDLGKDIGVGSFYDYKQGKEVGEGSFARVFQAVNKKTGAVVAIKQQKFSQEVLDETQTLDTTDFKDFLQEASLWYKLTRRNIKGVVKVFGYGVKPKPWIAMEFMPQGSLKEKVGTLDVNEASQVTIQLLESMNRVAELGVVHRDIKPGNILFTESKVPKLADWGLGRQLLEATQSLGYRGTPYYSAPEQFDMEVYGEISRKTDLYQLGAVYYELLTGQKPFPTRSMDELMKKILSDEMPDPPSKLNPQVPEALDRIVLKALSKQQEDRYEFMEMAREIRQVIE